MNYSITSLAIVADRVVGRVQVGADLVEFTCDFPATSSIDDFRASILEAAKTAVIRRRRQGDVERRLRGLLSQPLMVEIAARPPSISSAAVAITNGVLRAQVPVGVKGLLLLTPSREIACTANKLGVVEVHLGGETVSGIQTLDEFGQLGGTIIL